MAVMICVFYVVDDVGGSDAFTPDMTADGRLVVLELREVTGGAVDLSNCHHH